MKAYQPLFPALGLPPQAAQLALGRLSLEIDQIATPPLPYLFPPALIPFWLQDYGPVAFVGAWKHWFTPGRSLTYVYVDLSTGYRTKEYARTFEQLILRVIGPVDDLDEGPDDDQLQLADRFDIDPDELPELDITDHPAFSVDFPMWVIDSGKHYTGDFPYKSMPKTEQSLRQACGLELRGDSDEIRSLPFAPPWFTTADQSQVFDALLDSGDLSGAWMSLNSPGWSVVQIRESIERLADTAGDPAFQLLADAWLAQKHQPNVFGDPSGPGYAF